MLNNISSLITIILSEDDQKNRNAALKVMQTGNKQIIRSVAESSFLQGYTQDLTAEKNIEYLAMIIELCLSTFPELIRSSFKFLPQLAAYIHVSSVEYLFLNLLQSEEKYLPIHNFLKFVEFPKYVAGLAKNSENDAKIRYVKLLCNCLQNKVLMSCSSCPESIELIKNCINAPDNEIRKYAFKFIYQAVIIGDNDEEFAMIFVDSAISAFGAISEKYYYEYQVMALKFLCKLIQLRPSTTMLLEADNIIQSLCEIIEKFPFHSFALSAVFELVSHTIDDIHFMKPIFTKFIPLVIKIVEDPKSSTQHSFAIRFLHDLEVLASRDTVLENELTPEIKSAFLKYCEPFDEIIRSDSPVRCGELYDDIMDILEIPFGNYRTIFNPQMLV